MDGLSLTGSDAWACPRTACESMGTPWAGRDATISWDHYSNTHPLHPESSYFFT